MPVLSVDTRNRRNRWGRFLGLPTSRQDDAGRWSRSFAMEGREYQQHLAQLSTTPYAGRRWLKYNKLTLSHKSLEGEGGWGMRKMEEEAGQRYSRTLVFKHFCDVVSNKSWEEAEVATLQHSLLVQRNCVAFVDWCAQNSKHGRHYRHEHLLEKRSYSRLESFKDIGSCI